MTDLEPSLPERVVARMAATLDGSRPKRRSFLAGLAVAGSAIALKPWGFLVEDASATDVVCGSGNECSDGWTAFCCTVSGKNSCPSGSFPAGWWKADNAGYCCGKARYYIDCNASCGSTWSCHCASGTCDRRRVACNQFRYGQCHQEISCYGPVVCRVITCEPPWEWSSSCTSLSLTDNRTVTHNAPCLNNDCGGSTVAPTDPVAKLWKSLGGAAGVLGKKILAEQKAGSKGYRTLYANGAIYRIGSTVHEVHGTLWSWYCLFNAHNGQFGYPASNTLTAPDKVRKFSLFEHGAIVAKGPNGPAEIRGALYEKWVATGREKGSLKMPVAGTKTDTDGYTPFAYFDTGAVFARIGQGTFEVHGSIYAKWAKIGGRDLVGLPVGDVHTGVDGKTRFSLFDTGGIFARPSGHTYELHGPIYTKWRAIGAGRVLGYPTSDVITDPDGTSYSLFDKGRINYDPVAGTTSVIS